MSTKPDGDMHREKKMRAIDMLNHFINKRSQAKAKSVSPTARNWKNSRLSPPSNEQTNEDANDVSPTPKRRKFAQSSPVRKPEEHVLSMDVQLKLPATESLNDKAEGSPGTKSVAFSDKLDSSPTQRTMNSSPRQTPASAPSKSILRNPIEFQKDVSQMGDPAGKPKSKLAGRGGQVNDTFDDIDPTSLAFWEFGEVHKMLDSSNLKEFQKIIEGGLEILANNERSHVARRFEVYASFNNIIPPNNLKYHSELIEKKFDILIHNLKRIIEVSLPHLRTEQEKLLGAGNKKNPFGSRLYIQIVRLFGSLLAHHRVMRALTKLPSLKEQLAEVLELSKEALVHPNANKVIIGAQYTLLAYEKYGAYFLQKDDVMSIIRSVIRTKDIQSTNLICEKLHLMRKFLSKYTSVMLEIIPEWLPSEVLAQILSDEEAHSLSILQAGIAVVLDLLKKSLDSSAIHQTINRCIRNTLAKDVMPEGAQNLSVHGHSLEWGSTTLEELLQKEITFLIISKKEIKFAMDLWLAMMGLLYNTTEALLELSDTDKRGWLRLNHICFLSGNPSAKFIALKAWRIITYYSWAHVQGKSLHHDHALIRLLKKPFEFSSTSHLEPDVCEGLIYYLTGMVFVTCGNSKAQEQKTFKFFWENLISPIYQDFLFTSDSTKLKSAAVKLLAVLIDGKSETGTSKTKRPFPLKVIASVGVTTKDIEPVPADTVDDAYTLVLALVSNALSIDSSEWATRFELFDSMLRLLPPEFIDDTHFTIFLDLASRLFSQASIPKDPSTVLCPLVLSLTGPFANFVFESSKNFQKLLKGVEHFYGQDSEIRLTLMKEFSKKLRRQISEFTIIERFLEVGDLSCQTYASNWIGSVLLPNTLTTSELHSFASIVKLLLSPQAIGALLDFCVNSKDKLDICELLNIDSWGDEKVAIFVKAVVSLNSNKLVSSLAVKLQKMLPSRVSLFNELFTTLQTLKYEELIRHVIIANPEAANGIILLNGTQAAAVLPKALPRDTLSYFVSQLLNFDENAQLGIIKWILDLSEADLLFADRGEWNDCVFFRIEKDGEFSNEFKILIADTISQLYEKQSWKNLSQCILYCMTCGEEPCVEEVYVKMRDKIRENNSPKSPKADECKSLNSILSKSIKEIYQGDAIDTAFEVTTSLIELKKVQNLSSCREEFLNFFIIRASNFVSVEQATALELLERFIAVLMECFDEIILSFVESILSSILKVLTDHSLQVFGLLNHHLELKGHLFHKLENYKTLLEMSGESKLVKENVEAQCSNGGPTLLEPIHTGTTSNANDMDQDKNQSDDINKAAVSYIIEVPATQGILKSPESPEGRDSQREMNIVTSTLIHDTVESTEISSFVKMDVASQKASKEVAKGHESSDGVSRTPVSQAIPVTYTAAQTSVEEITTNKHKDAQVAGQEKGANIDKKKEATVESNDDFAPADTDQDDEFLLAMEQKMETRSNKLTQIMGQNPPEQKKLQSVSLDDVDAPASSKIRFPIFNSSKFQGRSVKVLNNTTNLTQDAKNADEKEPDNNARSNGQTLEESRCSEDAISRDATPSLRMHFPSKKARKLVNRVRAFTAEDLSHLPPEEKRNLRIELLDFLMSLEHEHGFYQ